MDLQTHQIKLEATSLIHDIDKGMFNVHAIKGFLLKFSDNKSQPVKMTKKAKEQELMASYISNLGKPKKNNT